MTSFVDWLATLVTNDAFGGVLGASLVATFFFSLKSLPGHIVSWARWRFVTEVSVNNDDVAFDRIAEWLAQLESTRKTRRLRLTTSYLEGEQNANIMTPADGYHVLRTRIGRVLLHRSSVAADASFFRRESFTFSRVGRPEKMRELMAEAMAMRTKGGLTPVFVFRGHWRRVSQKKRRDLASVILPPLQKSSIVGDIHEFIGRRAWYEARSLPYRRGYLFTGPPGTGKTSLALALAGEVGRGLYALNLGSMGSDDALFEAVLSVPEDGILLIEDIDACDATRDREAVAPSPALQLGDPAPVPGEPKKEQKITLSGLLNALDGVFTREGRIVIMTTNKPEKLDPALLRPGRADVREELARIGYREALEMAHRFDAGPAGVFYVQELKRNCKLPIAPAELQGMLLKLTGEEAA